MGVGHAQRVGLRERHSPGDAVVRGDESVKQSSRAQPAGAAIWRWMGRGGWRRGGKGTIARHVLSLPPSI